VRFYTFRTKEQVKVETMGVKKADTGALYECVAEMKSVGKKSFFT